MWDNYFEIDKQDHILKFNGLNLVSAFYEPDYGCYENVEFGNNYYVCGETHKRIYIETNYRGLKGTPNYQVDLLVDGDVVKTFMVQLTPMGEILTPKESAGW